MFDRSFEAICACFIFRFEAVGEESASAPVTGGSQIFTGCFIHFVIGRWVTATGRDSVHGRLFVAVAGSIDHDWGDENSPGA